MRRTESMERFEGIEFREHENLVNYFTSRVKWLDFAINVAAGTRPNFYPGPGLLPFLADFRDPLPAPRSGRLGPAAGRDLHLQPPRHAARDRRQRATIFDNHIARSRVNYQVNRELSFRGDPRLQRRARQPALVDLDRTKHLTADVLMTYLVHPGTAVYVGYTDGYDNVALDPAGRSHFTQPRRRPPGGSSS